MAIKRRYCTQFGSISDILSRMMGHCDSLGESVG
jgi:hypothetical protein